MFLLTSGVASVTAGPLVDAIGVRTMFRIAVIVFTFGGVAAAFVPTMTAMIAARAVQGIGAGLVIAVGLAGVSLIYPAHLVGRAFAANSTVWGVMGVAGPAIAAFMLTSLSWRWIFLVNLPLGALSLAAGWRVMPGPLAGARRRRLDLVGVALVLVFNLGLLLAIDRLGWTSVWWAIGAVLIAGVYWRHARTVDEPVMRLRHMASRPFGPLAISIALLMTGAIAANSFVPLYVQGGRGGSAALTAWSVLFFTIGWTVGANGSSRLLDRMAESSVMRLGFLTTIPSLALVAWSATAGAALPIVFALLFIGGVGIGSSTNAGLTLLRSLSPPDEIGRVVSAHQFYRNLGFALGTAVGGAVILFVVAAAVGDVEIVRDLLAGEATVASSEVSAAIVDGFATAAAVGTVLSLGGVIPLAMLRRHLAPARATRDASRTDPD